MNSIHNYQISVDVSYQLDEDITTKNRLPDHVNLDVSATGWKLLQALFIERNVELDMRSLGDSKVFLPNENILLFSGDFPSDLTILAISPDTILIDYDKKISKKVPVVLNTDFTFKKNYDLTGDITIIPDSILITGPKSVLDHYDVWTTERIRKKDINNDISGNAVLKRGDKENISISAIAIQYTAKVAAYQNATISFDINPFLNESFIASPSQFTIYHKYPEDSVQDNFQADFILNDSLKNAHEGIWNVQIEPLRSFVKVDSIVPPAVEIKKK